MQVFFGVTLLLGEFHLYKETCFPKEKEDFCGCAGGRHVGEPVSRLCSRNI